MALSKKQLKEMAAGIVEMMRLLDSGAATAQELRGRARSMPNGKGLCLLAWIDVAEAFHHCPKADGAASQAIEDPGESSMKTEAQGERVFYLWIGSKVEKDYERRGVFPELRSNKSIYAAQHGSRFKVTRSTIKEVAEDSIEQRAVKRNREERGLATSYGTMSKNLVRDLGMSIDVIARCPAPSQPNVGLPEFRKGTARQPAAWSDCLWRPSQ